MPKSWPTTAGQPFGDRHRCLNGNQHLEVLKSAFVNQDVLVQERMRPAFAKVMHALQAYAGVLADDKGIKATRRLSPADLLACGEVSNTPPCLAPLKTIPHMSTGLHLILSQLSQA